MASSEYQDGRRQEAPEEEAGEERHIYCWECQSCGQVVQSPYLRARDRGLCCDNQDMLEIAGPDDRRVSPDGTVFRCDLSRSEVRQRLHAYYRDYIDELLHAPAGRAEGQAVPDGQAKEEVMG